MSFLSRNFITVNEGLFEVLRIFREDQVANVDLVKDWLSSEIVFRKDGNYYFCNKIQELEYEQN
jgi:hypothetical protein